MYVQHAFWEAMSRAVCYFTTHSYVSIILVVLIGLLVQCTETLVALHFSPDFH